MLYFRFKILLKLGSQNDPSLVETFQGGMTELGEIYSCSQILCWTTGCCPYHTAVWITRFALTCTALVPQKWQQLRPPSVLPPTPPKCLCKGNVSPQLGKAYRPTQRGQHNTLRGRNCANRAVYTVSRFGRGSEQKHEEQNWELPLSERALAVPCPVGTAQSRQRRTTRHDGRCAHTRPLHGADRARTAPATSATRHPEITPRQQTVHPQRDNIAINRCILHYEPDESMRKDILHSGWSRSHRPKTANINRKLYLIL